MREGAHKKLDLVGRPEMLLFRCAQLSYLISFVLPIQFSDGIGTPNCGAMLFFSSLYTLLILPFVIWILCSNAISGISNPAGSAAIVLASFMSLANLPVWICCLEWSVYGKYMTMRTGILLLIGAGTVAAGGMTPSISEISWGPAFLTWGASIMLMCALAVSVGFKRIMKR